MSSGVRNEEEAIKIVYLTSRMGHIHSTDEAMIKGVTSRMGHTAQRR